MPVTKKYIQLLFQNISSAQAEQLIAELNEAGFEGFEEDNNDLKAFIASQDFDEAYANSIAEKLQVGFFKSTIEETNWNQVWESNFEPVIVDDFVLIRAHFHQPVKGVEQEIIITPKMSFGTGHHATTYMMIQQMRNIVFSDKAVLDFGTGTGILAILSQKMGAKSTVAVDHDEWSITNARENILQNNCPSIVLKKTDSALLNEQFDIILANINKNIILNNFPFLVKQLAPRGVLVLSGLLTEDEEEIRSEMLSAGLVLVNRIERHNWLSLSASWP